ncbi:CaiB/BaiF CoA-transferase family protein [Frigidibacter sp.]|uniref:CaiB/BaiF CoA transferase family protein n=1 Tax=Frigidibacter sp. TaxID=2586418 RepID=UPI002732BD5C|nr:CaiB/BaiF CoA-transferase family protein [Frigidibacter sp.]MDP3339313.1 CaiB/BaiF CoA-transferase family protein [Frigidibacter sp.]
MPGPLEHLRVLDLSRIMAGPWCCQILADLGAEVIKVERPGLGDDTRSWGPPYLKDSEGRDTRESGYYLSVNRGKQSITLDLATDEGRKTVLALAATCDVVVENFKSGTLDRMGLGYAALLAANPGIILASVTGFGQTGPRAGDAAYDFMIQAMSGLMSVTGPADGETGGGPQKVGVPIVDIMTGMYTAIAVLAAVANREQSGKGDHIDIAMQDVAVGFLANQAMNYLVSGTVPVRRGNRHPNIQPQDVFQVADGHLVLAVGNDGQFRAFAEALGRPQWGDDPRFSRNDARVENLAALHPLICEALSAQPLAHWLQELGHRGVPCGPINTIPMALEDPQIQHRRMVRELPHPLSGSVRHVVSPMNFANSPLALDRSAPLLGEDTEAVLARLAGSA